MEQFTTFVSIQIEHAYYTTPVSRHINLSPTLETEKLMRRRGILFMERADGWSWLMRDDCAGFETEDLLELSMQVTDANFLRVTKLEEYHPQNFYQLPLENKKNIDALTALAAVDEKKWVTEFCRIRIKPTTGLLKKARKGIPMNYIIRFLPMAYRWEYLFVVRDKSSDEIRNLLLEETQKRIIFEKAERLKNSPFGENVWRTVSASPVSALEHPLYVLFLSTVLQEYPLKKRTVSRFIPYPQPGQYISDAPEMIRKVCYI